MYTSIHEHVSGNRLYRVRVGSQVRLLQCSITASQHTAAQIQRLLSWPHRERKKAEYNELQSAVDQLTAQLAAIRALEARNEDLQAQNASLVDTHNMHAGAISSLQEEVSSLVEPSTCSKKSI